MLEVANAQIKHRRGKHLTGPLKEGTSMYAQQWELGEAAGIEVFIGIPKTLIDSATAIIKEQVENREDQAKS